jgi:hypothetical protein
VLTQVSLTENPIPKAPNVTIHSFISYLKKKREENEESRVGGGGTRDMGLEGGRTFIMIFDCNVDGSNVIPFVSSSSSGA